jgi:hypothetical protein
MALSDGTPGGSAQREHERRRRAREQRVRDRHPRIGGVLFALSDAPQHETAWRTGAEGEVRVARALEHHLRKHDTVHLFHDRRIRGSRANIDHLAVGPGGITVIDAKWLKGRVEVRRDGGILRPRRERLFVAGRDKAKLVEGLLRQVAAVREALPAADVRGAFCFADVEGLPTFGRLTVAGLAVCGPRGAARLARREGSLDPGVALDLARDVERLFPPA